MPDEKAADSSKDGAVSKPQWRQGDVKRAVAAAEQAGLSCYRVEITPDGTIAIVVGAPSTSAADMGAGEQPLP